MKRDSRGVADLFPLLRSSHIFASTVHELLQLDPLHRVCASPISPSQCNLLRIVSLNGRHPVGEVAGLLGISAPAATKTIDRLERLGLVERFTSEGDRRTHLFAVSAAGRALVRRCERLNLARLREAIADFDAEEIAAFTALLARFSVSLMSGQPDPGRSCLRCAAHIDRECPIGRIRGGCPHAKLAQAAARRRARPRARAGEDKPC